MLRLAPRAQLAVQACEAAHEVGAHRADAQGGATLAAATLLLRNTESITERTLAYGSVKILAPQPPVRGPRR
jgi:hypothetical protein